MNFSFFITLLILLKKTVLLQESHSFVNSN